MRGNVEVNYSWQSFKICSIGLIYFEYFSRVLQTGRYRTCCPSEFFIPQECVSGKNSVARNKVSYDITFIMKKRKCLLLYIRWGGYTGLTLSVRLSVHPSVRRRHGFRSISEVCFGISISNFLCMLIGRSLLIFSDITFKMAGWRPYSIFCFLDSNFRFALNISSKLQWRSTCVYG